MAFGSDAVGPLGQVDRRGIGLDQTGPPADCLGLHFVHQLRPHDPVGKAGEVLNVGGGHQLTAGDATVLEARDQHGAEIGPGGVNGGGVASGP